MVETAAEQFLMELARTESLEPCDCGQCPLFLFCDLWDFTEECSKAYQAFQDLIYDVGRRADRALLTSVR